MPFILTHTITAHTFIMFTMCVVNKERHALSFTAWYVFCNAIQPVPHSSYSSACGDAKQIQVCGPVKVEFLYEPGRMVTSPLDGDSSRILDELVRDWSRQPSSIQGESTAYIIRHVNNSVHATL